MRYSCAMTASRVTPPIEEEGADVERVEEVGGAAICVWGRHGLSCALLYRTVEPSMASIMGK